MPFDSGTRVKRLSGFVRTARGLYRVLHGIAPPTIARTTVHPDRLRPRVDAC